MKRFMFMMSLVLLLFSGCKTPQNTTSSTSQQTALISERVDSAINVAGDSARAALLLRCDSLGNVYLANLVTEQGRRMRLELLLQGAYNQRDSLFRALSAKNTAPAVSSPTAPQKQPRNTPLLLDIDCKEDSFELIVRGLRERVMYLEENKERVEVPVKYVPDYYKNCTRGFWTLLVVLIVAIALLIWKNWSKIAAWAIKIWAKCKFM